MSLHVDNIIETKGALILGAGVAGLFTALKLAPFPALVLADAHPGVSGSSARAQGGIAASVGRRRQLAGPCRRHDRGRRGPLRSADRGAGGARGRRAHRRSGRASARRSTARKDGSLAVGREAAHSAARIVHVSGDRAGAAVMRALAERALATPSITLLEGFHAIELAMEDGRVAGLFARYGAGRLRAPGAVPRPSGDPGDRRVWARSMPSPPIRRRPAAKASAWRRAPGRVIADPEFVQFHPTAIAVGRDPAPLATEALRGEGAILIDETGRRFMPAIHLTPNLVRATWSPAPSIARSPPGTRCSSIAAKPWAPNSRKHFPPSTRRAARRASIPAIQPIPVAPAAHYHMGGIATDTRGRSSLDGLWAVGECAATGLHGANRLASNSLLEALVFGARVAEDVRERGTRRPGRGTLPTPERFRRARRRRMRCATP